MREIARKAGWSLVTLLMFLGFLEILARRLGSEDQSHIQMDFDADLMWRLHGEAAGEIDYSVNSLGLRGGEVGEGVHLLSLGDSSI